MIVEVEKEERWPYYKLTEVKDERTDDHIEISLDLFQQYNAAQRRYEQLSKEIYEKLHERDTL